jgi:replicative DNA helicase
MNQPAWNYNEQAEQQVLGAMLEKPELIALASEMFGFDQPFYRRPHQIIWDAILSGQPTDPLSVAERIENPNDIGGSQYLYILLESTVASFDEEIFSHWCEIVAECHKRRILVSTFQKAINDIQGEVSTENAVTAISDVLMAQSRTAQVSMKDSIAMVEDDINKRISGERKIASYGIQMMDEVLGGMRSYQMVIGAGRPGSGKTAIAQVIAKNVASQGYPVLFITYEMPEEMLAKRCLVSEHDILDFHAVDQDSRSDWWKKHGSNFHEAKKSLEHLPIYFDYSHPYCHEIPSIVRRFKLRNPEAQFILVIVDYLQLVPAHGNLSLYERASIVSNTLQRVSRKLGVCVIALSQLSRSIERRADPKPVLSDLRDSGALEQDADVVFFIHRPWLFDKAVKPSDTWLIVGKNRNGPLEDIPLYFTPRKFTFEPG